MGSTPTSGTNRRKCVWWGDSGLTISVSSKGSSMDRCQACQAEFNADDEVVAGVELREAGSERASTGIPIGKLSLWHTEDWPGKQVGLREVDRGTFAEVSARISER
ncbi:MAG TPA: hypothetical protein VF153_03815 [Candidatus Limnocylindria bacterium]